MAVNIGGGVTVGGQSPQSRTDGGGLWMCEQNFLLARPEQRKAGRALLAEIDRTGKPVIVPRFVGEDGPGGEWAIDVSFAAPAALRATTATVTVTVGLPLTGGEPFTVVHPTKGPRTYDIATAGPLVDGEQVITFMPPLREAVTDDALDFQNVRCVMALRNQGELLAAMSVDRLIEANAMWVESFDAP